MTDDLEATLRQRAHEQAERDRAEGNYLVDPVLNAALLRELVAIVEAARRARHYCPASHLPRPSSPGPDPCDLCNAFAGLDAEVSPRAGTTGTYEQLENRQPAWCETHGDFAWLYDDGSVDCFYACRVESSCDGPVVTMALSPEHKETEKNG